jgi:hypothetical protein
VNSTACLICDILLTLRYRAYIAASRRSDRSLEARIESARRASEIHKKRTGRALRVTEEDVVNEEMYEEEDDDVLTQQRRLQTYLALNSGSIFDGRLNSWMLSAMGTRAMVMNNGFGPMQHQPTPFFPYNPPQSAAPAQTQLQTSAMAGQMYSSMNQQVQQQGPQSQPGTPLTPSASQSAGQSQDYKSTMAQYHSGLRRSVTSEQKQTSESTSPNLQSAGFQNQPSTPTTASSMNSVTQSPIQGNFYGTSNQPQENYGMQQTYSYPNQFSAYDPLNQYYNSAGMNVLSPSLPVEMQQMLGTGALDQLNPSTQMYMNQSHGMTLPAGGMNYTYNPNLSSSNKQRPNQQSSTGMSQTLSQSAFQPGQNDMVEAKTGRVSSPYESTPVSASDSDYGQQNYSFAYGGFGDGQSSNDGKQMDDESFNDIFNAEGDCA